MVAADLALESGGQVLEQMPPVGDMDGPRCSPAGTLAVDLGPVAGDHLDPGVVPKPPRDAVLLSVGQQVHNLVALQVHDGGAIAAPLAPGPLVDADHPRRRRGRHLRRADQADHGVRAGLDGEPCCHAAAGLPAQRQAEVPLQAGEAAGAAGERLSHPGQGLGKGLAWA